MVSLKQYLNRNEDEAVLRQTVSLLLEKIGSGVADIDKLEHEAFQDKIERILGSVAADSTPETLLLATGSATEALDAYNKRIGERFHEQGQEFRNVMNMLAETMVELGGENTRSAERLHEIGNRFESAGAIGDFAELKLNLGACLRDFREETLRQKSQAATLIAALREQIERSSAQAIAGAETTDPVTGLPGKAACLKAMNEPIRAGRRRYVVTLAVERLQSINARFGLKAGDLVLRTFADFAKQQLEPSDKLFRWSGTALVALLDRSETLDRVRTQIRRMMELRLEKSLELEERSILIPISSAWSTFQFSGTGSLAERQIQSFIASHDIRELA